MTKWKDVYKESLLIKDTPVIAVYFISKGRKNIPILTGLYFRIVQLLLCPILMTKQEYEKIVSDINEEE